MGCIVAGKEREMSAVAGGNLSSRQPHWTIYGRTFGNVPSMLVLFTDQSVAIERCVTDSGKTT
jgi:hypothetical protein